MKSRKFTIFLKKTRWF